MSSSSNTNVRVGSGIFGLTFLVFLVLKLCGVIAWSWWWVTAPLWMPMAAVLAVGVIVAAIKSWA